MIYIIGIIVSLIFLVLVSCHKLLTDINILLLSINEKLANQNEIISLKIYSKVTEN